LSIAIATLRPLLSPVSTRQNIPRGPASQSRRIRPPGSSQVAQDAPVFGLSRPQSFNLPRSTASNFSRSGVLSHRSLFFVPHSELNGHGVPNASLRHWRASREAIPLARPERGSWKVPVAGAHPGSSGPPSFYDEFVGQFGRTVRADPAFRRDSRF